MQLFNTTKGYDSQTRKDPWYQKSWFPLLPMFEYTPADEFNASHFNFSWLFIRVWSLEHLALEFAIEFESTGLNVKVILPYLRIVLRLIPTYGDFLYRFRRNGK